MKKQQWLILGVLGTVMAIIVFGPVLTNLGSRLATNKKLKQDLKDLEKKVVILEGIDRILVSERVNKMESVFPSDKPIVALISTLSQLSAKHNLNFGGVSLQPGNILQAKQEGKETKGKKSTLKQVADTGLQDLKFGFEVGGEFGQIINFMKDLEKVAPLMKIEKVGLTVKSNPLFTEKQTIVTANIDVSAYYQPAPKTLGTITKPVVLLSKDDESVLSTLFTFTQFPVVLPVAQTGKTDLFEAGL